MIINNKRKYFSQITHIIPPNAINVATFNGDCSPPALAEGLRRFSLKNVSLYKKTKPQISLHSAFLLQNPRFQLHYLRFLAKNEEFRFLTK